MTTVVYMVNASCSLKDSQTSLLFLEARLAQEMMDHDETHYCSISGKKLSRMRMFSVQKGVLARHRRVREIQHECYFMELTHDVFPVQQPINLCLRFPVDSSPVFGFSPPVLGATLPNPQP